MARVKTQESGTNQKSRWKNYHPAEDFTQWINLIDDNIAHAWVETTHDIVLDFMDVELLKAVLSDSGLVNKPFHFIWNLEHITDLSYHYKKNITDLLYYWRPAFGIIAFYNIAEPMRIMVDSFAAIVPAEVRVIEADHLHEALQKIRAFKDGEYIDSENHESISPTGDPDLNKRFLRSVAKMSWFNMLEDPIAIPSPDNHYYPFFKAIESLRLDLLAKDIEHKNEIALLRQDFEASKTQESIKIKAQAELSKQISIGLEKKIAHLQSRINVQDMELMRVSTANAEKAATLNHLRDQISTLEIDTQTKQRLQGSCRKLIESEMTEMQLKTGVTEADSVFLSKLHKKHPNLNQRELRICLLIKFDYDNIEIARTMGVSIRGLESFRYRMHKKLGLSKNRSIKVYLLEVAEA